MEVNCQVFPEEIKLMVYPYWCNPYLEELKEQTRRIYVYVNTVKIRASSLKGIEFNLDENEVKRAYCRPGKSPKILMEDIQNRLYFELFKRLKNQ